MVRDCFNCGAIFVPSDADMYLCDECEAKNRGMYFEEVVIERLTKRMDIMEEFFTLLLSGSADLDELKELSARYKDIT